MENNNIHCPKCNSTQLHFDKKGFSGKKAVVGAVLTGGIGLLAGTLGSNKILANCMSCGNQFSPVKNISLELSAPLKPKNRIEAIILMVFFYAITLFLIVLVAVNINEYSSIMLVFLISTMAITFIMAHTILLLLKN